MKLPHFVVNPLDRGNIHVTFSWAHSVSGTVAFPTTPPFLQRLQSSVPRVGDCVVLELEKPELFYVTAPVIWCGDNALVDVNYQGPVEFTSPEAFAAEVMGDSSEVAAS